MCFHPNKDVSEIILNICLFWNIYPEVCARVCPQQRQVCVYNQCRKVCVDNYYYCLLMAVRVSHPPPRQSQRILYRITAHLSINTADLRLWSDSSAWSCGCTVKWWTATARLPWNSPSFLPLWRSSRRSGRQSPGASTAGREGTRYPSFPPW